MIKLKTLLYESRILNPKNLSENNTHKQIEEIYRRILNYVKGGSKNGLDLSRTPIKKLPNYLKKVGGTLDLGESLIENLNNLEYVDWDLNLNRTSVKKLPDRLKKIKNNLWLGNSKIEDLNQLDYVGKDLDLRNTQIKILPNNLKKVGGNLILNDSQIQNLNNLNEVGGYLDLRNTPLSKLTTDEEIRNKIHVKICIYL